MPRWKKDSTVPDPKIIRQRYQLSQADFASKLGISLGTLRNWEQGRRTPEGPARVLLNFIEIHPELLLEINDDGSTITGSDSSGESDGTL